MPEKLGIAKMYRRVLDGFILRFPLPNINPTIVTVLAIPFSLAFIFLWEDYKIIAFFFYFLMIMSDWLDGVIARKYNRSSNRGWWIDSVTDRLTEGIIFLFFFWPWIYLYLLNLVLNIVSFFINKNIVLPLRFAFFIYLIIILIGNYL